MTSTSFNPYSMPLTDAGSDSNRQWQQRIRPSAMRLKCLYFCIVVAISLVATFDRVGTSLVFGPVLAIAGVLLAFSALKDRDVAIVLLGATAPLFALLTTLMIFQGFWSPSELKSGIQMLSCCYAIVIVPVAISLVIHRSYRAPVQVQATSRDQIWSYE